MADVQKTNGAIIVSTQSFGKDDLSAFLSWASEGSGRDGVSTAMRPSAGSMTPTGIGAPKDAFAMHNLLALWHG
jgi:hypothetical protein